ncbi:MAG: hypothetical protein ACO3RW_01850 [Burkholderiaceae bacterium]
MARDASKTRLIPKNHLRKHSDAGKRGLFAEASLCDCLRHRPQGKKVHHQKEKVMAKRGLYSNIAAKRKRIAAGSGEKMRKPGTKGAPTAAAFKAAAKTAKKRRK